MKKILTYTILGLALVLSCNKVELNESVSGTGVLRMAMTLSQQTKATTTDELLDSATVKIYKADFSGLVRSYLYSEMPDPFYLAVDTYRVDVEAGESTKKSPSIASWTDKSYKGSKQFSITNGNVTSLEVVANVNNAITCISFDESLDDNFTDDYTLTIGLDTLSFLVYDSSKSGDEGYFIIAGLDEPSFNWTFNGTLQKDSTEFTRSGVIDDIQTGTIYKMNLKYTIKDGDLSFTLYVDTTTENFDDTIIFEPVSTGLALSSAHEIWAAHATVHADVDTTENADAVVQFAYTSDGETWLYEDGEDNSDGTWQACLTELTPSTEYTYQLIINDEAVGDPLTFTTDAAPELPNGSFEYVSKVTGKSYYKFYDPNCGVDGATTMFWGSGNGEGPDGVNGSASMDIIITTIDTSEKKDGKQSVCAQTKSMVGILAAGNLFTGQFAGLVGTEGGKVNFGRPWTSRPTALKLYCKYSTGKINIIKGMPSGVSLTTSDYDRAQIKFALGTWNYKTYGGTAQSPVHVNTTSSKTFVDFTNDNSTIAYGDLIIYNDGYSINSDTKVTATTSGWIEYTIPLEYYDEITKPTHIIISCASSQYGDYFTGYDGSKLWIDAAELIYE